MKKSINTLFIVSITFSLLTMWSCKDVLSPKTKTILNIKTLDKKNNIDLDSVQIMVERGTIYPVVETQQRTDSMGNLALEIVSDKDATFTITSARENYLPAYEGTKNETKATATAGQTQNITLRFVPISYVLVKTKLGTFTTTNANDSLIVRAYAVTATTKKLQKTIGLRRIDCLNCIIANEFATAGGTQMNVEWELRRNRTKISEGFRNITTTDFLRTPVDINF